ncbi:MAG: glutamyl-tRNA reductase [Propionibacteriales bacterium]|nr:glutamyl-tRNA reductase [Propionibacteriales bacterium]
MSVLLVGASHRSATVEVLEQLAVDDEGAAKLRAAALDTDHVNEVVVLATCNRVEIYADVDRFHGSIDDLTALLVDRTDLSAESLTPSLYVHYDEAAVAHLMSVVTGLDSMVVGESQILGQVRTALRHGQDHQTVGNALNALFQQGLRVGKRAHAETGIDSAGQSLVSVALGEAAEIVGPLEGLRVCVVGAGSIAALAATSVRRAGAGEITVLSRTLFNAQRLADTVDGRAVDLSELASAIGSADLVITCTGATGVVISAAMMAQVMTERVIGTPLAIADLALPRDVETGVGQLPDVTVIGLESLAASVHNDATAEDVAAVRAIVAEEVTAFVAARDAARVAPTLVALRTMATGVVAAELERLWHRLDDLTPAQRDEVARAVRRVADKLLHEPSVRIKQLAGRSPESSYADALAELFALDPAAVDAVTRPGETT